MTTLRVLLTVALFSLIGCGNFFENKATSTPSARPLGAEGPYFEEIKAQVLAPHCIECHVAYADYAVVKGSLESIVSAVDTNRMPKSAPPLDDSLKGLLRNWLEAGAPEKAGASPEPVEKPGLQPNWDSLYVNIFAPRCTACHSPNGQASWIDLTNRAAMVKTLLEHMNFEDPAASYLVRRLKSPDEPMPPLPPDSNFQQLTPDEVDVVIEWIRLGLP